MNPASLIFLLVSAASIVVGFYLIYPPLSLIAGGVVSAGLAALLWEVE